MEIDNAIFQGLEISEHGGVSKCLWKSFGFLSGNLVVWLWKSLEIVEVEF